MIETPEDTRFVTYGNEYTFQLIVRTLFYSGYTFIVNPTVGAIAISAEGYEFLERSLK